MFTQHIDEDSPDLIRGHLADDYGRVVATWIWQRAPNELLVEVGAFGRRTQIPGSVEHLSRAELIDRLKELAADVSHQLRTDPPVR